MGYIWRENVQAGSGRERSVHDNATGAGCLTSSSVCHETAYKQDNSKSIKSTMLAHDPSKREQEKQVIEEGMSVWNHKKALDTARQLEEQRQLRIMLKNYNPWGKPGNGAPIPGSLRKSKWIINDSHTFDKPESVLTLGRPGHGAPLRTASGRTKTTLYSDPNIRFQFSGNARRCVDNELRYRISPEEKENYRKQLEHEIAQKSQIRKGTPHTPTPRAMERCKQGWSTEATLRRLPQHESEQMYEISGGVELVPLLTKHRATPRKPLPTTDVTCLAKVQNGPGKSPDSELIYQKQLSSQVHERQHQIQEERRADMEKSQRHYDTWKGLWGRPGHGAPKGCNLAKENLNVILYELPARRQSAA